MNARAAVGTLPERRSALFAIAAVTCSGTLAAVGSFLYHELHSGPTAFARVVQCLTQEKGLALTTPERDMIASRGEGAVRTIIEGNPVTVVRASDLAVAAGIERDYASLGANEPPGRLERRSRIVYLWDRPASPTQRQTAYDCEY